MAQSYIPAGTDVICTEMTGGEPAQLGLTREAKVLYGKEKKPLLNICDKKLSCSLECRIKQTFFSGLGGLLIGLAAGALVVTFVIATAGAGAAVVGAAAAIATTATNVAFVTSMALLVGGIASCGAATTYKYLANECDSSLEGEWSLFHRKVYLEKSNALLERSILTCSKGGIVSLVMDHAKAVELAKMISKTNNEIRNKNFWSKTKQGFIGNGANALLAGFEGQAGGAVVGLILGSGFSVYDYLKGGNSSYRDDTVVSQNNYAKLALEKDDDKVSINTKHDILTDDDMKNAGAGTAVGTGYSGAETVMSIITGNKILTKEAMSFNERAFEYMLKGDMAGAAHAMWASDLAYGAQKGMGDIPHEFWKGIWSGKTKAFKWNVSNKWFTLSGIGIGILSSIVSNQIEWGDNEEENLMYEKMMREIIATRKAKVGGINITAISL